MAVLILLPNAVQMSKDEELKKQYQYQKHTMGELKVTRTAEGIFLHKIHVCVTSLLLRLTCLSEAKGRLGHYMPISLLVPGTLKKSVLFLLEQLSSLESG